MKFVDYVTITIRSGSGGPGCVAFRREKYVPRGGPSGGDGGRGGSVFLEGDKNLYTLLDLRYKRHHYAQNGMPGEGANRTGSDGEDVILRVPPGTLARDRETDEIIGEVVEHGERILLAEGGMGGKGNTFFKSATHQAPHHAQPGRPGFEREIALELRLLADVGLVGFPNAGKSTLISVISEANPKIADYPFTTLTPQLGVVSVESYKSFVMADIPGIIEGAHEGKGLGIRFLKHIEHNAVLLFILSVESEDLAHEFAVLLRELESYDPILVGKPRLLGVSKIDLLDSAEFKRRAGENFGLPESETVLPFSSVAQKGLEPLKRALWQAIQSAREDE
ncbi:MAG TPA: GTPase ObgE [Rhodothermia bacterium]